MASDGRPSAPGPKRRGGHRGRQLIGRQRGTESVPSIGERPRGTPSSRGDPPPGSATLSALILAGGGSTRLGRPKALVSLSGRALIVHVADSLAPLVDDLIVSVADRQIARKIRSVLPSASFVQDARSGRGPIEGFRRGFRAARGEIVLVAPCDAPLLRTELYRLLVAVLGDYEAAVPKLDAFDPVRAVYRRSAVLRALASAPDIPSPSALVDRLRPVFVAADQIRTVDLTLASFLDVNTPEDLQQALQRMLSPGDRGG